MFFEEGIVFGRSPATSKVRALPSVRARTVKSSEQRGDARRLHLVAVAGVAG